MSGIIPHHKVVSRADNTRPLAQILSAAAVGACTPKWRSAAVVSWAGRYHIVVNEQTRLVARLSPLMERNMLWR